MAEKHNKHMHVWQEEEEIKDGNIPRGEKLGDREIIKISEKYSEYGVWVGADNSLRTFIAVHISVFLKVDIYEHLVC